MTKGTAPEEPEVDYFDFLQAAARDYVRRYGCPPVDAITAGDLATVGGHKVPVLLLYQLCLLEWRNRHPYEAWRYHYYGTGAPGQQRA